MLFKHAPEHYRPMLRAAPGDPELVVLERAGFGVSHDALGAALCESWGLGASAVSSVRHHVPAQASLELPAPPAKRTICALSVLAHVEEVNPQGMEDAAMVLAPQADLEPELLLRVLRQVREQQASAAANGR